MNEQAGISIHTRPWIKEMTNKDPRFRTGMSAPSSAVTYTGKESEKECLCVYAERIHFAVHLKLMNSSKATLRHKNFIYLFILSFSLFQGRFLRHMEVPRLGVMSAARSSKTLACSLLISGKTLCLVSYALGL